MSGLPDTRKSESRGRCQVCDEPATVVARDGGLSCGHPACLAYYYTNGLGCGLPSTPTAGDRVDTPFGLGRVVRVGREPDLLGGPYVTVELEGAGMTLDGFALLSLDDVELFA